MNFEEIEAINNEILQLRSSCSECGTSKGDIRSRYSFGVYAGRLCKECCFMYRDNCGLDGEQGNYADLDEPYWED